MNLNRFISSVSLLVCELSLRLTLVRKHLILFLFTSLRQTFPRKPTEWQRKLNIFRNNWKASLNFYFLFLYLFFSFTSFFFFLLLFLYENREGANFHSLLCLGSSAKLHLGLFPCLLSHSFCLFISAFRTDFWNSSGVSSFFWLFL